MLTRDDDRRLEIRRVWLARDQEKRYETDVLPFHDWLEQNRPELLKRGLGNTCELIYSDLRGLVRPSKV